MMLLEGRIVVVRRTCKLQRDLRRREEVAVRGRRRPRGRHVAEQREAAVARVARGAELVAAFTISDELPAGRNDGGREQPARLEMGHDVLVDARDDDAFQAVVSNVLGHASCHFPRQWPRCKRCKFVEHRVVRKQPRNLGARPRTVGELLEFHASLLLRQRARVEARDGVVKPLRERRCNGEV